MSKQKTTACIVTRKGMQIGKTELEVGASIDLTESQMAGHAGKYKLASVIEAEAKAGMDVKGIQKLQEDSDAMSGRIEFLEEQAESLEEALAAKDKLLAELEGSLPVSDNVTEELEEKSNLVIEQAEKIAELVKANKAITRKLNKATKG